MDYFEASQKIQTKASWVKWLLGGTSLLLVALAVMEFGLADADLDAFETVESLSGLFVLGALVSAVAFVTWSYQAHANLQTIGRSGIRHQDQATIWWWIVPFAFLFMPFRVMYETVRGSISAADDLEWRRGRLDPSAVWWTALWFAAVLTIRLSNTLTQQATSLDELETAIWVTALGTALLAGAGFACLLMIVRVTESQVQLLMARAGVGIPVLASGGSPSGQAVPTLSPSSNAGNEDLALPALAGTEHRPNRHCTGCGFKYLTDDRFCAQCGRERP